jgi:prepilin-type N-terminal cleavage/methylation domain-containing protein
MVEILDRNNTGLIFIQADTLILRVVFRTRASHGRSFFMPVREWWKWGSDWEGVMIFRLFHRKVLPLPWKPDPKKECGMTILELMTVLGIIGILAAIGIPTFLGVKDNSIVGTTEGNLAVVRKALNNYMVDSPSNRYPVGPLDYSGLRTQIPFANLPVLPDEAKILTGSVLYTSDGLTFTILARSTNRDYQQFTVTPQGIVRN